MRRHQVCIVGLGYMGLPTALLLATHGHSVLGYDTDAQKTQRLQSGEIPFEEKGLSTLFDAGKSRLSVLSSLNYESLSDVGTYIICVPTPFKPNKTCDLTYVDSAVNSLAPFLKKGDLIVLEATVTPGTTSGFVKNLLKASTPDVYSELDVAYVSEKAIPGNTLHEMVHNDRIIGGLSRTAANRARDLYATFVKGAIYITDTTTAEAVKVVENTFRDINIAFANELVRICEAIKVNVWEVIDLANKHPRVSIMMPGPGVGGHCIAIDPWFLHERYPSKLIEVARAINDSMPAYVVSNIARLATELGLLKPTVGVLGVAYKKNVDDSRDSPSKTIIDLCISNGWKTMAHDPHVKIFSHRLETDIDAVIQQCDILVLAADHDYYSKVDFGEKMVLDTRNMRLLAKNVVVLGKYA